MKTSYDTYDLFASTDEFMTRPKIRAPREKRFYPSEASIRVMDKDGDMVTHGGCLRASYFRLTEEPGGTPHEARSEYIFAQGKDVEEMLMGIWQKMGIWVDNNVKFIDREHNVSGEIDAVLAEPPDGKLYGVEVKSFYGYHAKKELFGNTRVKGFPKIPQLLQTLIYTHFFREQLAYFRMAYFARDSVDRRTFKIELKEEGELIYPVVDGEVIRWFTLNDVWDRYAQLQECLDSGQTPPNDYELMFSDEKIKDYFAKGKVGKTKYEDHLKGKLKKNEKIGDWQCRYCRYKDVCWK